MSELHLAQLATVVRWCVLNEGECIGDHPVVLKQAKAALAAISTPLSETKRSEGGFGQLVGDALDEMRSPEASALTTFGEQQAVNEAAWELVRRKADSNMNRCQELAQAAVAAYRASVERQRGALPAAPSSTDKERDDAALKLANEWKDWLPYPDSPRAEWDRFNLANAYVALAGARSAGVSCSKCGKTPPFPGGTRCQDLACPLVKWDTHSATEGRFEPTDKQLDALFYHFRVYVVAEAPAPDLKTLHQRQRACWDAVFNNPNAPDRSIDHG